MKAHKTAVNLFDEWASCDKDKGMEAGHSISVDRMIELIIPTLSKRDVYSILDVGCGNGWMLRKILSQIPNSFGLGIDGAAKMIENARMRDPNGFYECSDLDSWVPKEKYDIVVSMEVIYYLSDPVRFINSVYNSILAEQGVFVFGIDHYAENERSLSWSKDLGVRMETKSINQWVQIVSKSGFDDIHYEQYNSKENWSGTLIIKGTKNS